MSKVWQPVKGYEGIYEVSSDGHIKSLSRVINRLERRRLPVKEKILSPRVDAHGYRYVNLYKNKKYKSKKIHQLVAEAFLNHTPDGYTLVVNHKDFNTENNRVENLELVTQRENVSHRQNNGSSKHTGVSWNKKSGSCRLKLRLMGDRLA